MAQSCLEDMSLVRGSLTEEEFSWRGTASECSAFQTAYESFLKEQQDAQDTLALLIRDGVTTISLSALLCKEPSVSLLVDYPLLSAGAPSSPEGNIDVRVSIAAPTLQEGQKRSLNELLSTRLAEIKEEQVVSNPVFDIYSLLSEHISSHPVSSAAHEAPPAPVSETPQHSKSQRQGPVDMRRDIFWTHHLLAPSKRRDFNAWSSELDVWILVKIGYPGFLIFEGLAEGVEELCRRVKGLQWAALSHRSTVEYQHQPSVSLAKDQAIEEALLACKVAHGHAASKSKSGSAPSAQKGPIDSHKFRTGYEELESTGEIVARLKDASFPDEEVVGGLSLRVSSASRKDKG
ncbi:hypothetical protein IE81DRAFT_319820 [Ceraceosorus guamensis]|uniref:Uncharacterized protein n=1 Tax=Ceraceosorus guamensis TaxID=1522189 RepID=A0A316W7S1_9BASI|nr:hypothetical protein IE81DRAFT_319820 [Ceraceosorus guamensis]PWN45966.1 hypothetical protein IE81DRAFT_319820 [Ceraceosorus guamensis]